MVVCIEYSKVVFKRLNLYTLRCCLGFMLGRLDSGLHLCIFPEWVGMLATCKAEASNTVWRPFGPTSILISGAKRALSSSCFTLVELTSYKRPPSF